MSTAAPTTRPPTDDEVTAFVGRLSGDQKQAVLEHLLPPFLMHVNSPRTVADAAGNLLGYFIPVTTLDGVPLFAAESGEPLTTPVASASAPPGRRLRTVADGGMDPTDIGSGD